MLISNKIFNAVNEHLQLNWLSLSIIIVLVKTHTYSNKTDLQYVCPWHTNNRRQNRTANTAAMFSAHTKQEELLLLSFFPLEPFVGKYLPGLHLVTRFAKSFVFHRLYQKHLCIVTLPSRNTFNFSKYIMPRWWRSG